MRVFPKTGILLLLTAFSNQASIAAEQIIPTRLESKKFIAKVVFQANVSEFYSEPIFDNSGCIYLSMPHCAESVGEGEVPIHPEDFRVQIDRLDPSFRKVAEWRLPGSNWVAKDYYFLHYTNSNRILALFQNEFGQLPQSRRAIADH